ncbi:MAG: hypothetical protein FWF69_10540 [Firmicutes bacterium]|nr:hypothetical protein [Bacillota bacterium]
MDDLWPRLKKAKTDNAELDRLIGDYMPFIKKEVSKTPVFQMEFDDRLSSAMSVFMNCVRQYDENAGGFLPFAAACIRNRLIDEGKKLARYHAKVVPLGMDKNMETENPDEMARAKGEYEKEQKRSSLSEEIELLASGLAAFNITFSSLAGMGPKQKRSRNQCAMIAREIVSDVAMKEQFLRTRRIPKAELAERFKLSEKTLEKHRQYIVAIAVILSGDYPEIQAFLPEGGDRQ